MNVFTVDGCSPVMFCSARSWERWEGSLVGISAGEQRFASAHRQTFDPDWSSPSRMCHGGARPINVWFNWIWVRLPADGGCVLKPHFLRDGSLWLLRPLWLLCGCEDACSNLLEGDWAKEGYVCSVLYLLLGLCGAPLQRWLELFVICVIANYETDDAIGHRPYHPSVKAARICWGTQARRHTGTRMERVIQDTGGPGCTVSTVQEHVSL